MLDFEFFATHNGNECWCLNLSDLDYTSQEIGACNELCSGDEVNEYPTIATIYVRSCRRVNSHFVVK